VFSKKISDAVLEAIEGSPSGVAPLDVLESLRLSGRQTLKTTLSRLNRAGRILRLKRGVYSANPMRDGLACAQHLFNGYLGFSTALYVHGMITETPFTITVVTAGKSETRRIGEYEFRAVSLGKKAVGFEKKGGYVVSTRAKTLFDCLYLPRYSVEREKLAEAFRQARLSGKEWAEFDGYVKRFASGRVAETMRAAKKEIRNGGD